MKTYRCISCGHIYDPEFGNPESCISPGMAFEDLPDDWKCPICLVGKDGFKPVKIEY